MTRALEIDETLVGEEHVLVLTGRLDTNTSSQLNAVASRIYEADRSAAIVLDLQSCTFLSSAGLRVLVSMQKRASAGSGSLRLRNVGPDVRAVLETSGIDRVLTIE